jgi:hypothetical protein
VIRRRTLLGVPERHSSTQVAPCCDLTTERGRRTAQEGTRIARAFRSSNVRTATLATSTPLHKVLDKFADFDLHPDRPTGGSAV